MSNENDSGSWPSSLAMTLASYRRTLRLVPADPARPPENPVCPVCRNAGWVVRLAGASGIGILESCPELGCPVRGELARARVESALGSANIPPLYEAATLVEVCQAPETLVLVEDAMRDRRSLLFRGPAGSGKSYYAAALLRRELASGRVGRFCVLPDLLDLMRRSYGPGSTVRADDVLAAVETVDFLVLDDVGAEQLTDWAESKVYQIVNSRVNNRRQTIYTTNLTAAGLQRSYKERIASRMAGSAVPVKFAGADRRVTGQEGW